MTNPIIRPARVNPVLVHPDEKRVSLDGTWEFRLDPEDCGVRNHWFGSDEHHWSDIAVPGCWQGQGFGDDTTDTVWDFKLEARVFRATYKGTGWYRRCFELPSDWADKRVYLNFGGAHPSAEVWLNGMRLGENCLPFVPFGFEITDNVRRDTTQNTVVVRVHEHNREFGLAYSWQGNWSGLYRGVELTASEETRLDQLQIVPDVQRSCLRVHAVTDGTAATGHRSLRLAISPTPSGEPVVQHNVSLTNGTNEFEIAVPSPRLWSPDTPNLYRVDAELYGDNDTILDARTERVGFVELSTRGEHFLINREPYYMRGTGDFVSCPETGSPDTDRDRWRRKLKALREYGYNFVRCQSYLYAPEYFDAADEVGLLVQSEMGMLGGWAGHSQWHVYQWPKPTPDNYPILREQWNLSVVRDVNHPSANMYCMSNEYGRSTDFPRIAWQCYRETKQVKPTAFVIWSDHGLNPDLPAVHIPGQN